MRTSIVGMNIVNTPLSMEDSFTLQYQAIILLKHCHPIYCWGNGIWDIVFGNYFYGNCVKTM